MPILDRLFGRHGRRPDWASFMTDREFATFVTMVTADLAARSLDCVVDSGGGTVRVREGGEDRMTLGLGNVAQLWKQSWAGERLAVVHDHFDRILDLRARHDSQIQSLGADFEEARKLLKVRLYPSDMSGLGEVKTYAPAEGIVAALVYDLPDSVVSVHGKHIETWGVPVEELFRIGMENVRAEPPPERQDFALDGADGVHIHALMGDSLFTATRALFLEDVLPQPVSEFGALVAIPHRHMVIYHVIESARSMDALQTLIPMAEGIHREGPGSISPYVYWWREAAWWNDEPFMRIPAVVTDKRVEVTPPAEFVTKVLERLADR